jgi:pilus assembly protein CpaC
MSQVFDFADRIAQVSIADSGTADIEVINPFQLNLVGHKPGFTTLTVWTRQGHYEERQVRVSPSGKQQVLLNCMIAELNRTAIENQGVNLSAALTNYGVSLVGLPGAVGTPYSPQTNLGATGVAGLGATASTPPPGTLPPNGQIIPLLLSQGLTYALSAGNSNFQIQSLVQFLQQNNLAKILAQPNLLANSGEKAKFLSGGEIPIVIAQALNTSIVFKEFGTKVNFLPTVTGVNDIELVVAPEVSEPDFAHGVQLFGFSVPAFITRRADTVVQLKDNQTLIIAGLILHDKREIIQKVPYLGDIPYIAGFFRNTSWQNTESDLVMSVTPQIVRPLPTGAQVFSPTVAPQLTSDAIRTQRLATPDAARPRF